MNASNMCILIINNAYVLRFYIESSNYLFLT